MADEFVGSHEKSYTKVPGAKDNASGYGQGGSAVPSSTYTPKGNIPGVSVPTPSADAGDWQTRKVNAAPLKTHPGATGAKPGAKVPSATTRRAKDGVTRPTR